METFCFRNFIIFIWHPVYLVLQLQACIFRKNIIPLSAQFYTFVSFMSFMWNFAEFRRVLWVLWILCVSGICVHTNCKRIWNERGVMTQSFTHWNRILVSTIFQRYFGIFGIFGIFTGFWSITHLFIGLLGFLGDDLLDASWKIWMLWFWKEWGGCSDWIF